MSSPVVLNRYAQFSYALPDEPFTKENFQEEAPKPLFQFKEICDGLAQNLADSFENLGEALVELEEGQEGAEELAATTFIDSNPDVLLEFSVHTPDKVGTEFRAYLKKNKYLDIDSILKAVDHIYLIALINSKFGDSVKILNDNVKNYLSISTKKNVQTVIQSIRESISLPFIEEIRELERYSAALNKKVSEIDELLDLFPYASSEYREQILLLSKKTKLTVGGYRYPFCERFFSRFCQNIDLLSQEKKELMTLRVQILNRRNELQEKIGAFYLAQEQSVPIDATTPIDLDRERYFNEQQSFLWENGIQLLTNVFAATLMLKKNNRKIRFPNDFFQAVQNSSTLNSDWNGLQIGRLLPKRKRPEFPEFQAGYISSVWSDYTDDIAHLVDFGDFMRQFIQAMPKELFEMLVNPKDKNKALKRVFFDFFGEDATFFSLKEWALTTKPLKEKSEEKNE